MILPHGLFIITSEGSETILCDQWTGEWVRRGLHRSPTTTPQCVWGVGGRRGKITNWVTQAFMTGRWFLTNEKKLSNAWELFNNPW